VVLTSSAAAIRESNVSRVFTESDWNDAAVEAVKIKGSTAGYLASKTLAEKAAWEFVAAHKSEISWDLVALNPPYIFGVRLSFFCCAFTPRLMIPRSTTAVAQPRADC
jgi:nucleoside-diphosphate-sugar epimerase